MSTNHSVIEEVAYNEFKKVWIIEKCVRTNPELEELEEFDLILDDEERLSGLLLKDLVDLRDFLNRYITYQSCAAGPR